MRVRSRTLISKGWDGIWGISSREYFESSGSKA
jgi:hypothetical protein